MQKNIYCMYQCKDLSRDTKGEEILLSGKTTGCPSGVQPEEQGTALIKEEGI